MNVKQLTELIHNLLASPCSWKNDRGEYMLVNDAYARLAGTDPGSMTGKKTGNFFSSAFTLEEESTDARVLGERGIAEYDTELSIDAERRFFSCRKIVISDDDGKPGGIVCIMTETTTLRKAEESLRNFSLAVEQSPASIVITDAEGVIQYVNSTFTRVTGYSSDEAIGKNPRILKSGLQTGEYYTRMWNTISSGQSWRGEFHNKNKNGGLFWEIASISPIRDKSGAITSYIAVKEDITHLKVIEEELRRSEEKNREILDAIPDIMFKMDRSGAWLDESLAGKIDEVFPEEIRLAVREHIAKAFETGRIQLYEYPVTAQGSSDLFYEARFIISGEDEILAIVRNITDRVRVEREIKAARQAAENASRSKSDFLANMSHEIRTPINSISGFIELLKKTALDPVQEEYLEIIDRSAENLVGIINDILDFSKIESGKIEIESVTFNPFHEFEPTIEVFTERAQKKNIALYSFLDPALPSLINGDPLRIKQVLINLLSNAIKFTPDQGKIFIEIALTGDTGPACEVRFSVRDTGIGIPERKQKLIFEAFSQADSSVTRRYGGTGLGLSISSNLILLMGSALKLESQPGRGSVFHFDLRLEKCEPASPRGFPAGFRAFIHCPPEGDSHLNDLLYRYLKSFGAAPVHISGPGEIRNAPDRSVVFLIRPDDAEEGFNGLADSFKASGQPVIVVTGAMMPQNPATAHSDGTIQSPLNPSRLFNAIVELFDLPPGNQSGEDSSQTSGTLRFDAAALIAEDNPVNQKLITLLLQGYGLATDVASNGLDAFYMSGTRRYDIIFMDVNMPVTDGLESTQMILTREKERGEAHVPIIALTAMAIKGDRERILAAGMDDYLSKPIDMKNLENILKQWLRHSFDGAPDGTDRYRHPAPEAPLAPDRIDIEKTAAELGIPPEVLRKIVVEFLSSSDEYIAGLSAAAESEDLNTLYQAAHRLKGAAANLRLKTVSDLAGRIEISAKNGGGEEYLYLIARIGSQLEALKKGMK